MAEWYVDLIGRRLQPLGTVTAATERSAIDEAVERYDLDPASQFYTISVTKIIEKD